MNNCFEIALSFVLLTTINAFRIRSLFTFILLALLLKCREKVALSFCSCYEKTCSPRIALIKSFVVNIYKKINIKGSKWEAREPGSM